MRFIPEVGDIVKVKEFSYHNPVGGTAISDGSWKWNPQFKGEATVKIVHQFYDEECGNRYWAEAVNSELKDYIDANGHKIDKRIFVSEHDVIDYAK